MSGLTLSNPYLTNDLIPPVPKSYRYHQWCARGYSPALQPISPDSELGVFIGQMGWVGSHATAHNYLWGSAGNIGAILSETVDSDCLLPYDQSPRYSLPPEITAERLGGRHVLLTKSGARLDTIGLEHPALNLTIVEVEDDGVHYRMRFGTPLLPQLKEMQAKSSKPTSEMFHYMLIFDQLEEHGFKALVHLQPKFLNLISRSEQGHPSRFYNFLKGYEPETPIMYDECGGIGFVVEKAPGIPQLSYDSLGLFKMEDFPSDQRNGMRYILYWYGHGTFSRGEDVLEAYKHAEYFEASACMAWEAKQSQIHPEAYSEEEVDCILREFQSNQQSTQDVSSEAESVFNYP
jgi:ribulose-5-phosphate 4-epimerase/fuculose-1-phosphate aldolase